MTLPPYDGPQARQATATLNDPGIGGGTGLSPGDRGPATPPLGDGGAGRLPAAAAPGSPGVPGFAGSPAAPAPAASRPAAVETEPLNLARRPFVNTRPVLRVAAILWVLGVILLAANVILFMGYLTESQATRLKLAAIERDIAREHSANAELQGRLGTMRLEQQNRMVTFLNRKIDERTFSWSQLFDRMAEVLPDEVRLLRLKPSNVVQREIGLGARPSPAELKPPPVVLTMHCEAKDDEALLRFVDNLFAHPAFSEPNLESEDRQDNGLLRFDLTVQYEPTATAAPASPAAGRARPARSARQRPAFAPTNASGVLAGGAGDGAGTVGRPATPLPRPPSAAATAGTAAVTPPPAPPRTAGAAASPAGAGLVRVAPPPRMPGGGAVRGPAAPGTPGGTRPPGTVQPAEGSPPPAAPRRQAGLPPAEILDRGGRR